MFQPSMYNTPEIVTEKKEVLVLCRDKGDGKK